MLNTMGAQQVDLQVLEFAAFGKNWIVDNKLSPDALVQIAFQVYCSAIRLCCSVMPCVAV